VNVVGVEANSCSTFDTPHLHKARKGGKYLASAKKNSNEGNHDLKNNNDDNHNHEIVVVMATTTIEQQPRPWSISNNGDHGVAITKVTTK